MVYKVQLWDRDKLYYARAMHDQTLYESSLGNEGTDLSDYNHSEGDYVREFAFSDELDAFAFRMKWA